MLMLLTSPDAILKNGQPDPALIKALINTRSDQNPVALISNKDQPPWFEPCFKGSGVQFLKNPNRQSGALIKENAANLSIKAHDVIVLAAKDEDVQMGKNGGAILIAAGWSTAKQVRSLGICVADHAELEEIIGLTKSWPGDWHYSTQTPDYKVCALSDLSSYGKSTAQQEFAQLLTNTVKNGGGKLNALLSITARSLLIDGVNEKNDLVWGVYPPSNSSNIDQDILSDFTHRLRTTVSRVRYSQRGRPLFIRHTSSLKKSGNKNINRHDPTSQVTSIHLNPFYRDKSRLNNKNIIIVDDCTTYGVSFAVAAALLRKAGAASVTGISLGKFGNQLHYHEININSDPFEPIKAVDFTVKTQCLIENSHSNGAAQKILQTILA